MANFGASKPWIAEWVKDTEYANAFKCGELVNTSVNPQFNTTSLYGDNRKIEEIRLFKTADVTLGATRMPAQAAQIMFGHKTNEDGSELSNATDKNKYVGYAFITREMIEGKEKYRACLLFKVMFNEGQEDYETQGENITFKTPTISGGALTCDNGDWREKSPYFDTEGEADAWIKEKLGVEETEDAQEKSQSNDPVGNSHDLEQVESEEMDDRD